MLRNIEGASILLDKARDLKVAFDSLVSGGDKNLHYVTAPDLVRFKALVANLMGDHVVRLQLPDPLVNPTVGGVHPSDLGQKQMADYWIGFFGALL
jgi:hypothetical protein